MGSIEFFRQVGGMAGNMRYKIRAKLWQYSGSAGGWHFLTLPQKQSHQIKIIFADKKKPWGSLPIISTIGQTSWKTSLFPDRKAGAYVLPVKKEVRQKESLMNGDVVTMIIEVNASYRGMPRKDRA